MTTYRALTQPEIDQLISQQCKADDWNSIFVSPDFMPKSISNVYFSGHIRLGKFTNSYVLDGGITFHSGIQNAHIHNCTIEDDVLIHNIGGYLANCHIEENVQIINVHSIYTEGKPFFGNNVNAHVLNETGGREVAIFNELSAQIAYVMAMYRHRPQLINQLNELIYRYSKKYQSGICKIGKFTKIFNVGTIRNVNIGAYARLKGVSFLENGTINSNKDAHTRVGNNVTARDFIFSTGSTISDGAQITRCFIGQASHVSHLFSAHDSLFFSNCQMENGEACAIFAGPYSVSMHKSSLLIAAMYSFLNAGSGFNQSNHMYKLGPIHQGIVERGGRMASDSYILWPARIGPFTMVMGRHMNHMDTSDLPFSYLIQVGSESYLMPGANLQRVGTVRDAYKWPQRDKRTDPQTLDIINFDLLSPYTLQKMLIALNILSSLKEKKGDDVLIYSYQGAIIKKSSLEKGILLYKKAIHRYIGNTIIKKIKNKSVDNISTLRNILKEQTSLGMGEWVDIAGFLAPKSEIETILEKIEENKYASIQEVQTAFLNLQKEYDQLEWNWTCNLIESWYHLKLNEITKEQLSIILNNWLEAIISFDEHILEDAKKEFEGNAQIGFGIDDQEVRQFDFEAVRGTFDDQVFVHQIKDHLKDKSALFDKLNTRLKDL